MTEHRVPPPSVSGVDVDEKTRCEHYHSDLDIIAIRLKCCGEFYACKECHDVLADHPLESWPRTAFDTRAILCGNCSAQLTISAYLECNSRCPECAAEFNPRCSLHHHFYFSDV